MTKQQKFLYIVQTTILSNAVNLASFKEKPDKYRHVISASGILALASDAIDASERIPENMSALDAANDFCTWMLDNLRDIEKNAGAEINVPYWFARS